MEAISFRPIPAWTPELDVAYYAQVSKSYDPTGCWQWAGNLWPSGYGAFYVPSGVVGVPGITYRAHRVSYAWKYGDVPHWTLDHLCHVPRECEGGSICVHRRCVNPDHLEPVSRGENVRRGIKGASRRIVNGNFYKDSCLHGHEFTEVNTYVNPRGERQCRICLRAASERHKDRHRDEINAKRRAKRERVVYAERPCANCGLPFTPERSTGHHCRRRECINERQRNRRLGG